MKRLLLAAGLLASLAGCREPGSASAAMARGGESIPMQHARTFQVRERDGFRSVDIEASIVTWVVGGKLTTDTADVVFSAPDHRFRLKEPAP